MAKQTIKEKVLEAQEVLNNYTLHQELREWAVNNGLDSAAGFGSFKKVLLEIGIDYDLWKRNNGKPSESIIEKGEITPLELLARELGGRVWIKGNLRRIYNPSGQGDNYHYKGKWCLDFDEDGDYRGKCWLDDGYHNKKSEEYMAKHIRQMEYNCEEAMKELCMTRDNLAVFETLQAKEERIKREQEYQATIDEKVNAVRDSFSSDEDLVTVVESGLHEVPWS